MLSKLSVALSVVAAACALYALSRTPKPPVVEPMGDVFPPMAAADIPLECRQATNLSVLMRDGINKNMSKLSYHLFHSSGTPAQRNAKLIDATNALRGCMERVAAFEVHEPMERAGYRHHLLSSKRNLNALQTAAAEHDEGALHHWFGHLKQDCVTCHSSCRTQFPVPETEM